MKPNKLLHVLVALGAGLTGGIEAFGCGGATDATSASDAAADTANPGRGYGRISIDAAYGTIQPPPPPPPHDASPVDADADDAGDDDGGDAGDAG